MEPHKGLELETRGLLIQCPKLQNIAPFFKILDYFPLKQNKKLKQKVKINKSKSKTNLTENVLKNATYIFKSQYLKSLLSISIISYLLNQCHLEYFKLNISNGLFPLQKYMVLCFTNLFLSKGEQIPGQNFTNYFNFNHFNFNKSIPISVSIYFNAFQYSAAFDAACLLEARIL